MINDISLVNNFTKTEEDIQIDMMLDVVIELIQKNEEKSLTNTQIYVFQWLCQRKPGTYEEIAEKLEMSEQGVTAAAIAMYKILNDVIPTGGKINKKNFHSTAIPAINKILRERNKITASKFSTLHEVNNSEEKAISISEAETLNIRSANIKILDESEKVQKVKVFQENLDKNISTQIILESARIPVDLNSNFYIERKEDLEAVKHIEKPRAIIRLKGKRRTGATSLVGKITHYAQDLSGDKIVLINFKGAEEESLASPQFFIKWVLEEIEDQLEITNCLEKIWKDSRAKASAKKYFSRYLLKELSSSLIIIFDRLDIIFDPEKAQTQTIEAAQSFFSLVRTWIDASSTNDLWQKVKYIIVEGETNIHMPPGVSPFNVGREIKLLNFSREQIIDLAKRYGLNWSDNELDRLKTKLKDNLGHPQLTRLILNYLVENKLSFESLLEVNFETTEAFQECIDLLS